MADDLASHMETDDTLPPTSPEAASDGGESDDGAIEGVSAGMLLDGRYRIARLLGAGGMGAVYEARNERIDRAVAVKFLRPEMVRDKELVTRFLQEARTASQVHHRHIVEVLDSGQQGDLVWLVMELLRGESLQSLMDREGSLAPDRARALIDPICAALAHVHALGIIHRDVKPDNVFLASVPGVDEPVPKLLDFGIARLADSAMRLTATGDLLGTPAYMSPEQCMGQRDLTAAADQYALGATLFEMLSGKLPHTASNYNELVVKRATEDATRLEVARPGMPLAWCDLVAKTLARRPDERFASVDAMREAMRSIAHSTAAEPAPEALPVSVAVTPVAAPLAAAPTRSRARIALGAVFVIALAAALVWRMTETPVPTPVTIDVTPHPPRDAPLAAAPVAHDAAVTREDDASTAAIAATVAHDAATEPEHRSSHSSHGAHRTPQSRIDRRFPGGP